MDSRKLRTPELSSTKREKEKGVPASRVVCQPLGKAKEMNGLGEEGGEGNGRVMVVVVVVVGGVGGVVF